MNKNDKLIIERWELDGVINTFRMLITNIPKIKERGSCIDRCIMESYARLVFLYNGEKFDANDFVDYYMGKKDIPQLKG